MGQRFFLALENIFNRSFGEKNNPLYSLGTIANYLFWVVIFSGLYLYIFFQTSVIQAYASVLALSQEQPYAGGLIRSLHRYASDALILVIALHMLRQFIFNRYRGLRWFSWVSGIFILWITYASGINGYMLAWDRLSQFVVTTTAEWLDVIPILGGSMARNFISNANVSDRIFSLLSFIHIGLPLSLMALLWIHIQIVPGAKSLPSQRMMIFLTLILCALSLIKPIVSMEQADMASVVASINIDWFYLSTNALIAHSGPAIAWVVVTGGTAFLLLIPWLFVSPIQHKRSWRLTVAQDNKLITMFPGETLLDAGLREALPISFDCRNGGCGLCKCTVLHGKVLLLPYQSFSLSVQERLAGITLMCCAEAVSDIEISYEPLLGATPLLPHRYKALVSGLEPLSEKVMRVYLRMESGTDVLFKAGQYINIILTDGAKRSFSFASAYSANRDIELHVRRVKGGRFSNWVFQSMVVGDIVEFEGPLGSFTLRENSNKPIIFVAASTGFAPIKGILEYAFQTGTSRKMVLYWGGHSLEDFYLLDLIKQWNQNHSNFSFVPVLYAPVAQDHWDGRTGLLHQVILSDFPDLLEHQVYACGSVNMVQKAQPAFVQHGLLPEECFSDVFFLAPQTDIKTPSISISQVEASSG